MNTYNYSINITKENFIFYSIIKYIATFDSIKNYNCGIFQKKIIDNLQQTNTQNDLQQNTINNNYETEPNYEFILTLKAPYGVYDLLFKEQIINIQYNIYDTIVGVDKLATKYETILLSSSNKQILLDFFEEARLYDTPKIIPKNNDFITIKQYDLKSYQWIILSKLKKRQLSSVFLDKNIIDNLIDDINKFYKEEDIYHKYGIPYKRNYLLYGIPGTGKTSLIFAIASYLNMNVSIFNFVPGIDDTTFMKCINNIPNNSILLLEDIDGVFINRSKDYNNNSSITFSGILNTLDGMGRKDKLITFMTTNLKDQLDYALLRPGRIDYKVNFTYATTFQISNMFDIFIQNDTYKKEFLLYLKNKKITTCILQKFLFEYRDSNNIMEHINVFDEYINSYQISGKNLYT
tara:strand:- start:81 stop:1295 length:1215 start_codon:yes stop_codon:yes gene_type:complete